MASTRAVARALRLYTGIGLTALEELSDLKDAIGNESKAGSKPKPKKQYGIKSKTAKPAKSKTKSYQSSSPPKTAGKNEQTKTGDTDKSDGNKSNGDNKHGRSETQTLGKQTLLSLAQKKAIQQISRRKGLSENQELKSMVYDT